jgi:uncharacterized membrane protein YeaQ/YmgE (transglycosylase-associated protein family)
MLEIILIAVLAGKIGKIVEAKGRRKFPFQFMLVGLWIGGELFGGILGGVLTYTLSNDPDPPLVLAYLLALGGAIVGAVVSFVIANNLAPVPVEDEFYRGEDRPGTWADADVSKFGEKRRRGGEDVTSRPDDRTPPDDRVTH